MKLFIKPTLGDRLRQERDLRGLTQEQLAKAIGVTPLTVGKYELNKTSPTAEFLAQLETIGIDPLYVLTGKRQQASEDLPIAVVDALEQRGINTGQGLRKNQVCISATGLMWLLHLHAVRRMERDTTPIPWGRTVLEEIAVLDGTDMKAIHLQCITLHGRDQRTYRQLLVYEVQSPVHSPWGLSPDNTLQTRYELDALWTDLPLDFQATGADAFQPVLVLQDDEREALEDGQLLTIAPTGQTRTSVHNVPVGTASASTAGPQIHAKKIGTVSTGKIGKIIQNL